MFQYFFPALVAQQDANTRIQECQFAIPMFKLVEIKLGDVLERVFGRHESDARALFQAIVIAVRGDRRRIASDAQAFDCIAMFEPHPMGLAVAPDFQFEPFGQCVHD